MVTRGIKFSVQISYIAIVKSLKSSVVLVYTTDVHLSISIYIATGPFGYRIQDKL